MIKFSVYDIISMSENFSSKSLLACNIRRLRAQLKISQMELSKRTNLSVAFINSIENKQKWVSWLTLDKLARALDAKVFELFLPLDVSEESLKRAERDRHVILALQDILANYNTDNIQK